MNSGKGNIILLTVIAVATLLVSVVGATFAYFNATIPNSKSPKTIEVTSGTIFTDCNSSIVGGNNIAANAVLASRNINVTGYVTGSTNLNYDAKLVVNDNSYAEGELVYTITSKNVNSNGSTIVATSEPVTIPAGKTTINLGSGLFAGPAVKGAKHTYTLNIQYVNSEGNPAVDKTFNATIVVDQPSK